MFAGQGLVEPEKDDGEHEGQVEEIRREPEEIHSRRRSEEKGQGRQERRPGAGERGGVTIAHGQQQRQEQGVKDQEAVGPEDPDEGSGEQRIGPGFGVIDLPSGPALEKNALGPGFEPPVITDEVLTRILQVEIVGQAVGQGEINGLVGREKVLVDDGQVDRQGETQEKEDD